MGKFQLLNIFSGIIVVVAFGNVSSTNITDAIIDIREHFNYTGSSGQLKYAFNSKYGNFSWHLTDLKQGAIEAYLKRKVTNIFVI